MLLLFLDDFFPITLKVRDYIGYCEGKKEMPQTRIGNVFKTMSTTCPLEVYHPIWCLFLFFLSNFSFDVWNFLFVLRTQISLYAKCVIARGEEVDKGACEKEFQALKNCFRKVSRSYSLKCIEFTFFRYRHVLHQRSRI